MTDGELAYALAEAFFRDQPGKAELWWKAKNPLLGGASPAVMVLMGRETKLLRFVQNQLAENEPCTTNAIDPRTEEPAA